MMTNGWQEDSSVLSRASIALIKRENASLVAATGLIFERLKETSQDISLQDTLVSYKGGTWGDESVEGVGYPVLRSSNMRGKRVDVSDAAWCNVPAEQAKSFSLESGDILVIKSSGSIDLVGKAALFNDPNDGNTYLFSNFTMRLRPDRKKVIPEYLAWFLRSPQAFSWRFEKQQTTVGLRNLQSKEYLSQVVPIPNLDIQQQVVDYLNALENGSSSLDDFELPEILKEQRRIVARIEALAARVNQAQRLREEALEETKAILNSVSAECFKKIKTWRKLGDHLFDLIYRYPTFYNVVFTDSGVGLLKISNLTQQDWVIDFESKKEFIDEETSKRFPQTILESGDLVMAVRGATIGKIAYVSKEFAGFNINANLLRMKPNHKILNGKFFWYFMKSQTGQNQFQQLVTSTAKQTITVPKLKTIEVPVPSLEEQRKIVSYLDGLQTQLRQLRNLQDESQRELEALMPSILDKAFKGEL